LWKEEAEIKLRASEKRLIGLERDLKRERAKYSKATKALAGMEQALLAVEKQRKKLTQKPSTLTLEPWGCIEEDSELDGRVMQRDPYV